MNLLIIGGNGLLGSYTARVAIRHEHNVSILSRGGKLWDQKIDGKVRVIIGDIYKMKKDDFSKVLAGQDAVVYSLSIDDRELHKRPAYAVFHMDHVTLCMEILKIAQENGVKKFIVFGSYFSYFDRTNPEMMLAKKHPYIRTRCEQLERVLGETKPGFDSIVLELPYILGCLPGKVPPWAFLFSMLSNRGKWSLFFKKGGTAAVTANQVGQAAIGAIEKGVGGMAYAIGGCNFEWTEFAKAYARVSQRKKKLIALPPFVFCVFGVASAIILLLQGKERGISINNFVGFQYMEAFIDPLSTMTALGYSHDNYEEALDSLIKEWILLKSI